MSTQATPDDTVPARQRWARVSALFDEALELPAEARGAWLFDLKQTEPAVANELARLLQAHATRGGDDPLVRLPALGSQPAEAAAPFEAGRGLQAGHLVGPWRLSAPLGAGGMAV